MPTLNDYIVETRRLLHDVNGNFWTTPEIIDYVNDARAHVVQDSGCKRVIQSFTMSVGQETIAYSPYHRVLIRLIFLISTSIGVTPASRCTTWRGQILTPSCGSGKTTTAGPLAFSIYGVKTIYIGPKPDQTYELEIDTVVLPTALVNTGDDDTDIPTPFTEAVAYFAAHKAKYQEQSYGESEIFKQEYTKQVIGALNSTFTRRLPSPYQSGY
jgi:hypothetical protein